MLSYNQISFITRQFSYFPAAVANFADKTDDAITDTIADRMSFGVLGVATGAASIPACHLPSAEARTLVRA